MNDQITETDTFTYTIPHILQYRALHTPDETAYIFLKDGETDEERITYAQLYKAALKVAAQLSSAGGRGSLALMLFSPGLEFVKSLYGCFYAGVIAVPAYPPRKNRSLDRIKTLVVDSGAGIVLTTADIYQSFERSFSDLEDLKQMKWVCIDQPNEVTAGQSPEIVLPEPQDLALLQYTSGSTGKPKGVMVTHQNIMRNLEFFRQSFKLSNAGISVTWLPAFHDMGLIDGVIGPVYNGCRSVIISPVAFIQKPVRWLKAISRYKATHSGGPNFAFDLCVEAITSEEKNELDLSTIRTLYCGAEPIRKSTLDRFVNTFRSQGFKPEMLYPGYGMAETTLVISGPGADRGPVYLCVSDEALTHNSIRQSEAGGPDARWLAGIGHPWIDTTVKIVNPETMLPCADDEVGEIWVSGSIVTAGYWKKPLETELTFKAQIKGDEGHQYLRTGDLGFFHQGELYITGRLKDVIILHGRNYYPQDIEFVAEASHAALRPNASAAFPVDVNDEEKLVIVAEVERSAIRDLDVEKVCDAIRQAVTAEFEQEVYAIQLLRTAAIPKTSSGKIQRKACKQGFIEKSLQVVGESVWEAAPVEAVSGSTAPDLTSLQAWLMAWIHVNLKVPFDKIDLSKQIASFGLNSMKAVQLQQDFLDRYGINVPPYLFFDKITVKEVCDKAFGMIEKED